MITAVKKSKEDFMGFTWFEIFQDGKTTSKKYKAVDEEHAIAMHNLL